MATTLRFGDVAPGKPFHAALVTLRPETDSPSGMHDHADFYELVFALDGAGRQSVGDEVLPMRPGFLALVRPRDRHDFAVAAGHRLQFINLAFPAGTWRTFVDLAALEPAADWDRVSLPPHTLVPAADIDAVSAEFHRALRCYLHGPHTIDLLRTLATTVPMLQPAATATRSVTPDWLTNACTAMTAEENLRGGVTRFRELAAVSAGHLSRSTTRYLQRRPADLVTQWRVEHGRLLLASTTEPVTTIARRCGFASPSYFSYCFRSRYGASPRAYRTAARRSVVP
jgi:AraC-like DNA-binding protein/mannose-6-phosphate isomerase-like protein (cupin superfamily)